MCNPCGNILIFPTHFQTLANATAIALDEQRVAEEQGVEMLKKDDERRNAHRARLEDETADWRDGYIKAVTDLDARLLADKKAKHDALAARLAQKKAGRVQELIEKKHMSPKQAEKQAQKEIDAELAVESAKIDAESKAAETAAKAELESQPEFDSSALKKKLADSMAKLDADLLAEKEAERRKLKEMLAAKCAARKQQLVDSGVAPEKAAAMAEAEHDKALEVSIIFCLT